jgi:hypothetical protein
MHGRWTESIDDLGVAAPRDAGLRDPQVETTTSLFEASVALDAGERHQRWHIRQDSWIWMEEAAEKGRDGKGSQ